MFLVLEGTAGALVSPRAVSDSPFLLLPPFLPLYPLSWASALPMGTHVTCVTACGATSSLDGAGRELRSCWSPAVTGATPGGDTEGSIESLGF